MKKAIVLISDSNYLEYAKSLFYSIKSTGQWDGDLCLIANNVDEENLKDFISFNIEIIHKKIDNYYYANFYVFDEYMKKWDFIIYMDCDFTIFDNLNNIIDYDLLNKELINVDVEPFHIREYFCQNWTSDDISKSLLITLENEYDLNRYGFNAGFIAFNTSIIKKNTVNDLFKLCDYLQPINNHTSPTGSDQPIFNLYFENKINYIKDKKISFWKESNMNTIAQHHCRWEAPWVNNFYSSRLNKTYNQYYQENLYNFYASVNKI